MTSLPVDRAQVRTCFPSLASGFGYLDNAGGSQIPDVVIDAMADYCRTSYVQTGGSYPASVATKCLLDETHAFVAEFLNAGSTGGVILGASSTALVHLLANAFGETLRPGDEIIVADSNHEGNATPWYRLERFGIKVIPWPVDSKSMICELGALERLLGARTRVVAFPHVSNLTGIIADVRAISEVVRAAGAIAVCDGVAFAPHRAIDVQALGCDFYFYSTYKVYGPHLGAMYGRHEAWAPLTGPNHVFIAQDSFPSKWELGSIPYEGCAGLLGLRTYLAFLAGESYAGNATVQRAFATMADLEHAPHERMYTYLAGKRGIRIIGPKTFSPDAVGTLSFRHATKSSAEIAHAVNRHELGIKHGNFYSVRLLHALDIDPDDGVSRVSLVHYNTVEEIDRLAGVLDELL